LSKVNLKKFFSNPSGRQRQYEALRAVFLEEMLYNEAAKKFGYKTNTLHTLASKAKSGKLILFPEIPIGPRKRSTPDNIVDKIIEYRKKDRLSTTDIHERLKEQGVKITPRTVERILKDAGFGKLARRTNIERGVTKKNKIIPESSENIDFQKLEKFVVDCPVAGIFLFLPYIIESGILEIIKKCELPESSVIGSTQACLSMLLLKLIGNERLGNMDNYDHEPGLGIFAGLNVLPKTTYMNTYSCRTSEDMLNSLQEEILNKFTNTYSEFYGGDYINLDFHSIPHYGEDSNMEKIWCGSRNKTMKGANTIFAQDSKANMIVYTRTDILRKEESEEIKRFIEYWKKIKSRDVKETLVFDCRFTKYTVLNEIANNGVKFITLRKRSKEIIVDALNIPKEEWKRVKIDIPKRKHSRISVYEGIVNLTDCDNSFRQIIVKDHGRNKPTFIITNNQNLSLKKILEVYAKRWRIENKLSELVAFFNLNALSSPLMIRIHFDILWTFIADTFYHILAKDLRRFESHDSKTIFKKFINIPGRVRYDGFKFQIKMRKRAHTPIIKSIKKLNKPFKVPWLNNKEIEIIWTA
jgi:transposase